MPRAELWEAKINCNLFNAGRFLLFNLIPTGVFNLLFSFWGVTGQPKPTKDKQDGFLVKDTRRQYRYLKSRLTRKVIEKLCFVTETGSNTI